MGLVSFNHLPKSLRNCVLSSFNEEQRAIINRISEELVVSLQTTSKEPEIENLNNRMVEVIQEKTQYLQGFLATIRGPEVLGENGDISDPVAKYSLMVDCLVQKYSRDLMDDLNLEPPHQVQPEHLYALRKKMEADLKATNELNLGNSSRKILIFDSRSFDELINVLSVKRENPPKLSIEFSEFNNDQIEKLCQLIKSHYISSLKLTSCALKDHDAFHLAKAITKSDYSFTGLDISSNRITDHGAQCFKDPLRSKTISLNLTNNYLSDEAKQKLKDVSDRSSSFSTLEI